MVRLPPFVWGCALDVGEYGAQLERDASDERAAPGAKGEGGGVGGEEGVREGVGAVGDGLACGRVRMRVRVEAGGWGGESARAMGVRACR